MVGVDATLEVEKLRVIDLYLRLIFYIEVLFRCNTIASIVREFDGNYLVRMDELLLQKIWR